MKKLQSLERLETSFNKLPSVGKRSAERMAYAVLNMSEEDAIEFANAIVELKHSIKKCSVCGNFMENDGLCNICSDESRNKELLMVVSFAKDIIAFENSEGFNGLYHVLGGVIAPSKGIGVESLNFDSLIKRIETGQIKEVILATNPTIEGETTALYLAKKLEAYKVNVTRLAYGLTMGGQLDYTDSVTLVRALEGRRKL